MSVEVQGDDIVITLPGTSYVVTYYRAAAFPQQLLTKSHSGREDEGARNVGVWRNGARTDLNAYELLLLPGQPHRNPVYKRDGTLAVRAGDRGGDQV